MGAGRHRANAHPRTRGARALRREPRRHPAHALVRRCAARRARRARDARVLRRLPAARRDGERLERAAARRDRYPRRGLRAAASQHPPAHRIPELSALGASGHPDDLHAAAERSALPARRAAALGERALRPRPRRADPARGSRLPARRRPGARDRPSPARLLPERPARLVPGHRRRRRARAHAGGGASLREALRRRALRAPVVDRGRCHRGAQGIGARAERRGTAFARASRQAAQAHCRGRQGGARRVARSGSGEEPPLLRGALVVERRARHRHPRDLRARRSVRRRGCFAPRAAHPLRPRSGFAESRRRRHPRRPQRREILARCIRAQGLRGERRARPGRRSAAPRGRHPRAAQSRAQPQARRRPGRAAAPARRGPRAAEHRRADGGRERSPAHRRDARQHLAPGTHRGHRQRQRRRGRTRARPGRYRAHQHRVPAPGHRGCRRGDHRARRHKARHQRVSARAGRTRHPHRDQPPR